MVQVDKKRLGYETYRENIASEIGLINVYAYHCYRCNYTWLPRDFDLNRHEPFKENAKWLYWGHDLFFREPPKSCARCKSKYWKSVIPRRKIKKLHPVLKGKKWINEETINRFPFFNNVARLRALNRQGKLTPNDILQI